MFSFPRRRDRRPEGELVRYRVTYRTVDEAGSATFVTDPMPYRRDRSARDFYPLVMPRPSVEYNPAVYSGRYYTPPITLTFELVEDEDAEQELDDLHQEQ